MRNQIGSPPTLWICGFTPPQNRIKGGSSSYSIPLPRWLFGRPFCSPGLGSARKVTVSSMKQSLARTCCPVARRRKRDCTWVRHLLALACSSGDREARSVRIVRPRSQHRRISCANVKHYWGRMLEQKIVSEIGKVLSRASTGISQALLP